MNNLNTMVVDSRMGVGKTTKIIDYISKADHPVLVLVERQTEVCLLYTSPSPRDQRGSRMPSSA